MAEVINATFDENKKFVDFGGLDYFWAKAKAYVDGVDTAMAATVAANKAAIEQALASEKAVRAEEDTRLAGLIASEAETREGEVKDAKDAALALDAAMDARVKVLEAIDHDKLAADASAAAVATVLDGAPEKFDTLKEIAQWIADTETADSAADLVTRVSALETEDVRLAGLIASEAETRMGELADVKDAYTTAVTNAIAHTDSLNEAMTTRVDGVVDNLDSAVATLGAEDARLAGLIASEAETRMGELADVKDAYTALVTETAATTAADAKAYTDALYTSITFVTTDDIDSLF